ncbi:MAG: hypothetical protein P4L50_09110 [Anaerolineaceae bacterium]|nr:hypothetical protein [Anaerolineaceae bacterium]
MNRKRISSIFLPLLGMVLTLACGYGCSILNQALQYENGRSFQINLILPLSFALTGFLSTGAVILLFWGMMTRSSRSKWVGWIFTMTGGILVALPNILFYNVGLFNDFKWGYPLFYSTFALIDSPYYEAKMGIILIGLLIMILPGSPSAGKDRSDIPIQPPVL